MNLGLIHSRNPTSPVVLWRPKGDTVGYDLSSESSSKDPPHKSIFDRNGYKSSDGTNLRIRTHQFRHLLNTYSQRGGLSQLYIAKWSGRVNVAQNRVYNHMSDYELVDKAKSFDLDKSKFGPNTKIKKYN